MAGEGLIVAGAMGVGAIVGSFLGTVAERMPVGRNALRGRSACDHCGKALGPAEMVPVLSWLALRGRCRRCGGAIGGWQWAAELGAGALAATAFALMPPGEALVATLFGWQVLLLALLDARHFWLPRGLTGLLALSGLVALMLAWPGVPEPALGLAAGACGYALLLLVARGYRGLRGRDGLGGGDPPLLGAIGLWLGPQGLADTLLGASLLGLLLAIAMRASGRKIGRETPLPLGTLLAVTAWPVFVWQATG